MIKYCLAALAAIVFSSVVIAEGAQAPDATELVIDEVEAPGAGFPPPMRDTRSTGVELRDAWVRAVPPFQPNSAAYLTIINHRDTAIAVVGARVDAAQRAELHTTRMVEGLMRMEKLEGIAVAPGEQSVLAPGGNHLMLFNLAFRPVPGDDITLCLQLATDEEICVLSGVRKSSAGHAH